MRELLLLLCRYPFDQENKDQLRELLNQVEDWNKTVELINSHGIIALAAYNVKEAGLEKEIPEDAMAILENGQRQSMVRNLWLTERWKEVNTILSDAGIKQILLKGMALEHTLYGSRGLRQMNDNDILVKHEDALKAWNLLQQYGFEPELMKSPLHRKFMLDIGKHLPCLYKDGYAIEIHHKLFNNKPLTLLDPGDPVDTSVEIMIGDTEAWILSKEIQLMHLIEHFERHAGEGSVQFRQFADIILLDNTSKITIPESFISNPQQEFERKYLKAAYKTTINSVPARIRLQYIIGDIFPTIEWMKKRYKCSGLKAVFYYPQRIGKLLWLV
jgi:hypothetical protein